LIEGRGERVPQHGSVTVRPGRPKLRRRWRCYLFGHSWRALATNGYRARCRRCNLLLREIETVPGSVAPTAGAEQPRFLLFIATATGYALVERPAAPGTAGEVVDVAEFPDSRFRIAKIGRSPLPGDDRRCAYLDRVD
jgi:hypothetical protein